MRVRSTVTSVPWFLLLFHKNMWCLLCKISLFALCFAVSILCAQMVETSPCGPWAIITFSQLFVKVNDMCMCDLLCSLFCHSLHLITLAGKLAGGTLDRKQCRL